MARSFERTHEALPQTFDHAPIDARLRAAIPHIGISPDLFQFCVNDTEQNPVTSEKRYEELLADYFRWLPKGTPRAHRELCKAVLLSHVAVFIKREFEAKAQKRDDQKAFLGAAAQHRFIRTLLHLDPEDHRIVYEEMWKWSSVFNELEGTWKIILTGAIAVVKIIKAAILTKQRCTIYLPSVLEDVYFGIDLFLELPFSGLYVDVKSVREGDDLFTINWFDTEVSASENERLSFKERAVKTNHVYNQSWLPIQLFVSRDQSDNHDSRITQAHVVAMEQIFSQTTRRFIQHMTPRGRSGLGRVKRRRRPR